MTGNEIPAWFWMIIIAWLAVLLGLILYYIAMVMKETAGTIKETSEVVKSSNKLVTESTEILSDLKGTAKMLNTVMKEVSDSILPPIKKIGTLLNAVTTVLDKITGFIGPKS